MQKKKLSVGLIFSKYSGDNQDTMLIKALGKKVNLVKLPFEEQANFEVLKEKTKDCLIIINNAVWEPVTFEGIELSKTFENMGKIVINSSKSFFYNEDKWLFYLKCIENNLPTPKTYIIPKEGKHNSKEIKLMLENNEVVLKSVFSDKGLCVEKAKDYDNFIKKLKAIVRKNPISPIIAQEFIPNKNRSYRVTLIGNKVKQAVVRIGKSWKQTGNEKKEHFRKIKIDKKLRNMCEKASVIFGMGICGLDLINNSGKWYIIEANGCPALDFINNETSKLVKIFANYVYELCRKKAKIRMK